MKCLFTHFMINGFKCCALTHWGIAGIPQRPGTFQTRQSACTRAENHNDTANVLNQNRHMHVQMFMCRKRVFWGGGGWVFTNNLSMIWSSAGATSNLPTQSKKKNPPPPPQHSLSPSMLWTWFLYPVCMSGIQCICKRYVVAARIVNNSRAPKICLQIIWPHLYLLQEDSLLSICYAKKVGELTSRPFFGHQPKCYLAQCYWNPCRPVEFPKHNIYPKEVDYSVLKSNEKKKK